MSQKMFVKSFLTAALAGGIALTASGNVIITPGTMLNGNFSAIGTASGVSGRSNAPGIESGSQAVFGNLGFNYSFTPGVDSDNYSPAANLNYGNGELASGLSQADLPDGGTGLYRVFATWNSSDNVGGGLTNYVMNHDSGQLSFSIDQNDSAHGDGAHGGAPGANKWVYLGTVELTAGSTYVLTQSSSESSYVGTRTSGVMFEAIPEPSTYAAIFGGLALIGAFVYRRRLAAKK